MPALKLGSSGPNVKKLQQAANGHLGRRKFGWRKIDADGKLGKQSLDAIHMVAWLLGFSEEQLRKIHGGSITAHVFDTITRQKARTNAMVKRDQKRRDQAGKLRRAHRNKGTLASVKVRQTPESYGGSRDVMDQFVKPFLVGKYGLPIGSEKRTPSHNAAIGGSPSSDHLTTKLTTWATDFPTYSGEAAARALAKAFGWTDWQPNSYATFDFTCDGHRFRLQILWGSSIGHGDHIHVGISLLA